jgi:amino acid permease
VDKNNIFFRSWYYFRTGWSTYFAFILAAINTLTVTYFLAIENYPDLKSIFPSFEQYVTIIMLIGIPLLVFVGYIHFKRTRAFKSEIDVLIESNPYQRRNTVNGEINLKLNLKLISMLIKLSKNESLSENDIKDTQKLYDEIITFSDERRFANNLDLVYLKKEIAKL